MKWYHVLYSSSIGWTKPELLQDVTTSAEAKELATLEASIETETMMLSAGIDIVLILRNWDGVDLNQVGDLEEVMQRYQGYFVKYSYDDLFKSQDLEEINAGGSAQYKSRRQTEHESSRRRPADDDAVLLENLLSQRELLRTQIAKQKLAKRAAKQQLREDRRDARLNRQLARAERGVDRFCARLESFGYALDVLDDFLNS